MRKLVLGIVVFASLIACDSEKKSSQQTVKMSEDTLNLDAITLMVPDGWQVQEPSSKMRQAQYLLPRHSEETEDAELVVFYFGSGNAGSVEANLERWRSQMKGAEGETTKSTANGMSVTTLDVTGAYAQSMGPMMQAGETKPDYRMVASIVESPAGAYYFKLTGPGSTVAHWNDSFAAFIASAKGS